MSAFIVSEGTMDHVVWFLYKQDDLGPVLTALRNQGLTALGQALFDMNGDSVCQRYGDTPGDYRSYRFPQPLDYTEGQGFKALECLIYQSCEGNVDQTPLFKELKAIEDSMVSYKQRLPGYKTAKGTANRA